ncbi:MAG: PaaI family thioesterase [Actinobacteria bacterium]|nr:PaaI family thioesterase [Actinomycetota bacterium]
MPRPPLSHLFGYRVTQVGLGTATLTMPASPWFQTLDEQMVIDVLVEAALSMAALTGAPPDSTVRIISISVNRFRPVTLESGGLVARARTLNTGRTFNFTEVMVQDSFGRQVLNATGAAVFRPVPPSGAGPPGPPVELSPIDAPSYPTPDPYLHSPAKSSCPTPSGNWPAAAAFS